AAQTKAEEFFGNAVRYFMNEEYRRVLLDETAPELPGEVVTVTGEQAAWYGKFSRLQLAQAIVAQDSRPSPFDQISKDLVTKALKDVSVSAVYAEQTGKLYSLGYCVARPRISLYLDGSTAWATNYFDHVTSADFAVGLLSRPFPAAVIAETGSKLGTLDIS